MFGLRAPVIKAHGSSDAHAIFHAVRQAREMVVNDVIQTVKQSIAEIKE
ncbi:hypothetical protein ACP3W2_27565 [Salmonella enterica]